jgi:hypothetical protein
VYTDALACLDSLLLYEDYLCVGSSFTWKSDESKAKKHALDHVVVLLDDVLQQVKISLIRIPDAGGMKGAVVDQHLQVNSDANLNT